jgi:hypothetical protein
VQIIQQAAYGSVDGPGFVSTHAIQKSAGDECFDVSIGYLKQVAAKPTLTTFPHSFHADAARAAVRGFGKRTGV